MLFVFTVFFSFISQAAPSFFAQGEYVSTNLKGFSVGLKIDRKAKIKTSFPMTLPQGAQVAISFPEPLYWNSELENFFTTGWFAVQMNVPGVSVICQYPVRLEASFLNGATEADVTLSFSQRYFFKEGRCTREGEAETFHIFRRTKN